MTCTANSDMKPSDLPVVQYLNQRITFDLLATLQDGFSQFKTLETQYSDSSTASSSVEGGIGSKNVFALLGISLGGKISESDEDSQQEVTKEQLVHTPSSLFAKLRDQLKSMNLVNEISESGDLNEIYAGYFVEFEATLHRAQVIEALGALESLIPLMGAFTQDSNSPSGKGRNSRRSNKSAENSLSKQVETFRNALEGGGSQDLIAKVGDKNFILTVKDDCFTDPTMNDVLDGEFRVFGKVTRVVRHDSESINLLRKAPLAKFSQGDESLGSAVDELDKMNFDGGVSGTTIAGPTLQVIPIAIFA